MDWFARDFDDPAYFEIYRDKEEDANREGQALAACLNPVAGDLVLDLPCGWGRLRPALELRGCRVLGGDLSPRNLARHASEHPGPIVRLDLRALPFRDARADAILCAYTSWGYFATEAENLRQLTEFARVLRPGGVLLLDLAGRMALERLVALTGGRWYAVPRTDYRERVRWSEGGRRILTDRIIQGRRFRHDIWIPGDGEVRKALRSAGFELEQAWGGLDGEPWSPSATRWIYRALKLACVPGAPSMAHDPHSLSSTTDSEL